MKILVKTTIVCFLTSLLLWGQKEVTQPKIIHKLIQEIKKNPTVDKRIAINKLKKLLRTMNKETQKKVMIELQKSLTHNQHFKNNIHHTSLSHSKGAQCQNINLPSPSKGSNTPHPISPIKNTPPKTSPGIPIHAPIRTSPIKMFPGGHK